MKLVLLLKNEMLKKCKTGKRKLGQQTVFYTKDEADRVTKNDRGQGAAMVLQLLPADHSWPVTPLRNELETEPSNYLLFRLLLQSWRHNSGHWSCKPFYHGWSIDSPLGRSSIPDNDASRWFHPRIVINHCTSLEIFTVIDRSQRIHLKRK